MPDFSRIEKKWQKRWEDKNIFKAKSKGRKYYVLELFPYPSASGLHMGHLRNYSIGDAFARFMRMRGFNVLYPMGYDAFGLPAENAAIKNGTHPRKYTLKAIEGIKTNQKAMGLSYDWSRELATCDPDYYRWNQWIFLKFLGNGLAYKKKSPVNWCPSCGTVLANEQVESGRCWRCNSEVEEKRIEQWFFKITDYADELLNDLKKLKGWPEKIRTMQENWIGKSVGVNIKMKLIDSDEYIETFTTRHDTMFGMTFIVIAPEHPKVMQWVRGTKYEQQTIDFVNEVKKLTLIERTTTEKKPKRGVFLGKYAEHPFTKERIPIYAADFVLLDFGTGIVQAVPAHDQRDFDFAKEYDLPIIVTVQPEGRKLHSETMKEAYEGYGKLVNSREFNGLASEKAMEEIAKKLEKMKSGRRTTAYKLRDWGISRQRYWGTPIPIIYCDKCGIVPVPEKDLPVKLPEDLKFTGQGNPLASSEKFLKVKCPKCKGPARRETDTMDTFVDSSWYFLRYCDPLSRQMFDKKAVKYWMPVDQYIGGAEHAVMHLLYARFFIKAMRDLNLLDFDEPFTRLYNQGIVYKDGHKMSKSFGNVVTQEEIAKKYGIDAARVFLLFVASPDKEMEWSDMGLVGAYKFIKRVWHLKAQAKRSGKHNLQDRQMLSKLHSLIRNVTSDMEAFRFNLALNRLMSFTSDLQKYRDAHKEVFRQCHESLILMLSPFMPHMCEEIWERSGNKSFISLQDWPKHNEKLIDRRMEILEDLTEQTRSDIKEIIRLVAKKPETIRIYISPAWKFQACRKARKAEKEESKDLVKKLMKDERIRKHGKEAVAYITSLQKKGKTEWKEISSEKEEFEALESKKKDLEAEFSAKVEIVDSEKSDSPRARKAEPGKPGIEIV